MNTFEGIPVDDTPSEEIQDEKQYRNKMKKLRQLKTKGPSDENLKKIKILEILINEYEDKQKDLKEDTSDKSKSKKRNIKKKKKKKENEFLEKEFQKNREYWKNYEKEQLEEKKREAEERRRRQEERIRQQEEMRRRKAERKRRQEEERRRKEYERKWIEEMDALTYARNNKKEFFKKFGINDIPPDLSNILDNYVHKEYHKLSRIYHPDKSDNQEYFKALNEIKDLNNPRSVKHDETWQK